MSELDVIKKAAKEVLRTSPLRGAVDNFFWDRAERLARNVDYICELPELKKQDIQIDRLCLAAAAYFSEAGRTMSRLPAINIGVNNKNVDDYLKVSGQIAEKKLKGVVSGERLEKIILIIMESNRRMTTSTEAMILSDARNLDDVGMVGILNEFTGYFIGGKGVGDGLKIWKHKKDYGYWQARLKEGFRFKSVRKCAEQRLAAAEEFIKQLRFEDSSQDLQESCLNSSVL